MHESESNERTPLIERQQEEPRQSQDERHEVQDLGPFKHQPFELYEPIATKDWNSFKEIVTSTDQLAEALKTSLKTGLSTDQVEQDAEERKYRESVYGRNALPEKQMKTFQQMLWEAFDDKVLWVLSVAAVVSFALGLYQDFGPQVFRTPTRLKKDL